MNNPAKKIFEVYVFVYAFLFASRPLSDGDFWWHLKTGEYIVQTRTIPTTDFFSFTNFGKPWVTHEWLSEVIFYLVYSSLGFNALIFIFAVLTAVAFWIAYKRSNTHPFIGGFASLLGVWAILPTVGVRPRAFTLLFASIYLALLIGFSKSGKGNGIWWLPPLMVLWVNLHGGFLIGLVLIGLTIVGIPLDAWAAGKSLRSLWPRIRILALVLLACLIGVNLNPRGPRIYLFPFEIFMSPIQQQEINDWISPNFHQPELLPLALLILLTIFVIGLSPRRPSPSEILFFLTTLYATLKSNRHMAIFALVAAPLLATYMQNWISSTSLEKMLRGDLATSKSRSSLAFSALLLVPLLAFGAKLKNSIYIPQTQEMTGVPVKAVEYMKENQIRGNTFTDPNIWGGYFIWELPSNPVYIDGRIDMYGDAFVKEFLNIIRGRIDWRDPFERYGVENVVIEPKSMLARQFLDSPEWQSVYEDSMTIVFTKR